MIKKILKLEGAQQLSKKEQNTIHGGAEKCVGQTQGQCYGTCGAIYCLPTFLWCDSGYFYESWVCTNGNQ